MKEWIEKVCITILVLTGVPCAGWVVAETLEYIFDAENWMWLIF